MFICRQAELNPGSGIIAGNLMIAGGAVFFQHSPAISKSFSCIIVPFHIFLDVSMI
jgi:hypothetical protein